MLELLLIARADISAVSSNSNTALYYIVIYKEAGNIYILIDASIKLKVTNNKGQTPLYLAIIIAYKRYNKALIKAKANINIRDNTRSIVLYYAGFKGRLKSYIK